MTSLLAELSAIAGAAFAAEGLSPSLGQVQVSDRPDLAQFQCNGALAAAKTAKANPRAIAEKIAARLRESPLFGEVDDRGSRLHQSEARTTRRWSTRLQCAVRDSPTAALPESGQGQARHRRFRRAEHRQAHACRTSALGHHRRLPAAAVPRQRLVGRRATCISAIGACRWAS